MNDHAIAFRLVSRYRSTTHLMAMTPDGDIRVAVCTNGMTALPTHAATAGSTPTPPEHPAQADSIWRHNQPDQRVPQQVVDAYNAMTAAAEAPHGKRFAPSTPIAAATWDASDGWRRHEPDQGRLGNA